MSITGRTRSDSPEAEEVAETASVAKAERSVKAEGAGKAEEGTDVAEAEEVAGDAVEAGAAGRRPGWFRWLVAVALLFAVAGGTLQVMAWRARHTHVNTDRALTDTETTSVVIGDVSNGLSKIFSYAPDSTATTEQAAADVLAGAASSQYRTLFAQVKEHAAAEHLTLTTHVVRAGVTRLSGGTAQLLVFLDQTIVRKDTPKGTSAAAQLSVTARLDSGHWRIIEIHAR